MTNDPYRSRGYLPHLETPGGTYFITLRLAGTLPKSVLDEIRSEINELRSEKLNQLLSLAEEQRLKYLESIKIQDYLDNSFGECWLRDERIAEIIQEAVLHYDGDRYVSHVCCIMPNHLHWILTPQDKPGMGKLDSRLVPIIQKFKSFTAHTANKILQRTGPFWSREYYDHLIRTSEEFNNLVEYTIQNPVKARFCSHWNQWPLTTCSKTLLGVLSEEK